MTKKTRRKYSDEFKGEAVKLVTDQGYNTTKVARNLGIHEGRKVKVDCTVVESNIHTQYNSELLVDSNRVFAELLTEGKEGCWVLFCDSLIIDGNQNDETCKS